MRKRIPLFDLSINKRTYKLISEVLRSGWLSTGSVVAAFEQKTARFLGVKHVCAVNSATAGLELALRAVGVKEKSEVITSPLTFVSTVEVILRLGATPVFADIDANTMTLDPESVRRRVTDRTAAILPVDLAGHPSDYGKLRRLARTASLPIVSDAAHSFGALYRGKSMGRMADAAVYSFQSTKNLTTGDGGLVVTRTKKMIDAVRLGARHGMSRNAHERKNKCAWEYDISMLGMKGSMPDILAAIGLGQLTSLAADQKRRERIASRYSRNLSGLSELCERPVVMSDCRHGWHLYIIKLNLAPLKIDRKRFIRLMTGRGVGCGVHYRPVFDFDYFRRLGYDGGKTPIVVDAAKRVVSLPIFPTLRLSDVDYVCNCVADILLANRR